MMISIMKDKSKLILALIFWIIVWEIVSLIIANPIIIVSPIDVLLRLVQLIQSFSFYHAVIASISKILLGWFSAFIIALILVWLSKINQWVYTLVQPLMQCLKTIPLASFVILLLLWFSSSSLTFWVSFIMALPLFYVPLILKMMHLNVQLEQVRKIFDVKPYAYLTKMVLPQLDNDLYSSIKLSIGLCFKSGIAAELIGLPNHSIGSFLYESKIYLQTADLFAWTIVIVLCSVVIEKCVLTLYQRLVVGISNGKID